MAVENFSAMLENTVQSGAIQREVEEGLDSVQGFRQVATQEIIPAGIGDTLTRTRKGRLTVAQIPTPISPLSAIDINDGLSPMTYSIEQYLLTLYDYAAATGDIDALQNQVGSFDQVLAISRNSGVYFAQLRERLARNAMYQSYMGGNTRVRTDLGAGSTTTCYVDDITGFTSTLVNGKPTPVGGGVNLTVYETGSVTQTLTVTGVTAGATNYSTNPLGTSGYLTFSVATLPVVGDALVAATAPAILRPNGKTTTAALAAGDIMTTQLILDALVLMENNAIPPLSDGTFAMFCPPKTRRELMADQDFKTWYAGREQSQVWKKGYILSDIGVTFIPVTEVFIQGASTNGTGGTLDTVAQNIYRPILCGAEGLIEGVFEGMMNYVRNIEGGGTSPVDVVLVDNIAQILRKPIDRLGRWWSFAGDWIGGYAVPTDVTASSAVNIPTASAAALKRYTIFEHV